MVGNQKTEVLFVIGVIVTAQPQVGMDSLIANFGIFLNYQGARADMVELFCRIQMLASFLFVFLKIEVRLQPIQAMGGVVHGNDQTSEGFHWLVADVEQGEQEIDLLNRYRTGGVDVVDADGTDNQNW